jgi:hypothetical protein
MQCMEAACSACSGGSMHCMQCEEVACSACRRGGSMQCAEEDSCSVVVAHLRACAQVLRLLPCSRLRACRVLSNLNTWLGARHADQ